MIPTASCPRCGAPASGADFCAACGAALDPPPEVSAAQPDAPPALPARPVDAPPAIAQWWRRRHVAATAIALAACAIGAFAIFAIHRTMPAVPPGFERGAHAVAPASGDEAEDLPEHRTEAGHAPAPHPETASSAGQRPEAEYPAGQQPEPGMPAVQATGPAPRENAAPAPRFEAHAPDLRPPPEAGAARSGERLAALQQAQCAETALLGRVVCNERVRLRYCRDRWNAHPDCIVAAPSDPVQ